MTRSRLGLIAVAIVLTFGAQSASADTLSEAYDALKVKNYSRAYTKVNAYYAAGGARRYRADFIRAASECRLYYNSSRLRDLRVDYVLTAAAAAEVKDWIGSCKRPPPAPPPQVAGNTNGDSSISSGLETPPPVESGSVGPEPRPLPRMSPLLARTAYIGDDYASPTLASPEDCRRRCQLQAPCRSMSYDLNTKQCWLKRSVPAVGHGDNYVASYKIID